MSKGTLDRKAVSLALISYISWGLFPIYWKFLNRLPAVEILAHRFVWSFFFYLLLYFFAGPKQGKWQTLISQDRKSWAAAALAALLLGINWGVYIYAVNSGQVLQGSLAYFINPLLVVAVGVILFQEPFPRVLKVAISLAGLGVIYQAAFTPAFPWIALTLAISFCSYGIIKKRLVIKPELSSFMEGAAGLIPALIAAVLLRSSSSFSLTTTEWLLLMGSAVITGLPLFCFSYATQKLPYSLMGMMQFISPTLQFMVGLFVYGENLHPSSLISFSLIWFGVGCYLIYQVNRLQISNRSTKLG